MRENQTELASYLLARKIDDRPVEGKDLERLVRANDTVLETHAMLPLGRSNVDVEVRATNNENWLRIRAARELVPPNDGRPNYTWSQKFLSLAGTSAAENAMLRSVYRAKANPPNLTLTPCRSTRDEA